VAGEPNPVRWRGVQPVEGIRGIWPARNSTRIHEYGVVVGAGDGVIYTVPSGKIAFIASSQLSANNAAAASTIGRITVRDENDVNVYHIAMLAQGGAGGMEASGSYLPALEVKAGYDVYVNSSHANLTLRGLIFGWLEDA